MYTYKDSIWIIFTDEKKWVIELTKEGTLWYNYYFFKNLFKYVSMDDIEYQDYITKWVEKTIQNGVRCTQRQDYLQKWPIENTIQNGVKHAISEINQDILWIEKTIQNGVKHTEYGDWLDGDKRLDDIIQNGVKETELHKGVRPSAVENTIENGVKETWGYDKQSKVRVDNVLEYGVKDTVGLKSDLKATVDVIVDNSK
jgi:hypothetical protein